MCVFEFNKVNKTQKLKRVMRSGEFKDKFASYNALLKCVLRSLASLASRLGAEAACAPRPCSDIIQDLTLVTVTDAAAHAKVVAEAARDAAAAERADLASLTEEVRLVRMRLRSRWLALRCLTPSPLRAGQYLAAEHAAEGGARGRHGQVRGEDAARGQGGAGSAAGAAKLLRCTSPFVLTPSAARRRKPLRKRRRCARWRRRASRTPPL